MHQSGHDCDVHRRSLFRYYHRITYVSSPSLGVQQALSRYFTVKTSAIPGINDCYHNTGSLGIYLPFLLLFAYELGSFPGMHAHRCLLIHAFPRTRIAHGHMRHTELADDQQPSAYGLADAQRLILRVRSV